MGSGKNDEPVINKHHAFASGAIVGLAAAGPGMVATWTAGGVITTLAAWTPSLVGLAQAPVRVRW